MRDYYKSHKPEKALKRVMLMKIIKLVEKVATRYVDRGVKPSVLAGIGLMPLYEAYSLYKSHDEIEFEFPEYYTWWAKTAIETYLGESDEPLDFIPRRNG